jgi:hypothetical protein
MFRLLYRYLVGSSTNILTKGLLPIEMKAFTTAVYGDRIVDNVSHLIKSISSLPERFWLGADIAIFIYVVLPYVVLFTVIIIIYMLCNKSPPGPPGPPGSTPPSSSMFPSLPSGVRMQLYSINPFGSPQPTIARSLIQSGRCDNVNFIEDTPEGEAGHCEVSQSPDPITWTIDSSQLSEYAYLPKDLIKLLNPKLQVTIPYTREPEASFFVPQCDHAVYSDGTPADIYDDFGMSCKLKTKSIINALDHDQNQTTGYYSVSDKPHPEHVVTTDARTATA